MVAEGLENSRTKKHAKRVVARTGFLLSNDDSRVLFPFLYDYMCEVPSRALEWSWQCTLTFINHVYGIRIGMMLTTVECAAGAVTGMIRAVAIVATVTGPEVEQLRLGRWWSRGCCWWCGCWKNKRVHVLLVNKCTEYDL